MTRIVGVAAGAVVGMTVLMTAQDRDRAKVADSYKWNLTDVYRESGDLAGTEREDHRGDPAFRGVPRASLPPPQPRWRMPST